MIANLRLFTFEKLLRFVKNKDIQDAFERNLRPYNIKGASFLMSYVFAIHGSKECRFENDKVRKLIKAAEAMVEAYEGRLLETGQSGDFQSLVDEYKACGKAWSLDVTEKNEAHKRHKTCSLEAIPPMENGHLGHELMLNGNFKLTDSCVKPEDVEMQRALDDKTWAALSEQLKDECFYLAVLILQDACKHFHPRRISVPTTFRSWEGFQDFLLDAIRAFKDVQDDARTTAMDAKLAPLLAMPDDLAKMTALLRFAQDQGRIVDVDVIHNRAKHIKPIIEQFGVLYLRGAFAKKHSELPKLDASIALVKSEFGGVTHDKFMEYVARNATPDNIPETLEFDASRLCAMRASGNYDNLATISKLHKDVHGHLFDQRVAHIH